MRDYYAEAFRVANLLEKDGLVAEAQALVDAIESGSTGTEILMALRFYLQKIDQAGLSMSFQTRRQVRDLSAAIDVSLGS